MKGRMLRLLSRLWVGDHRYQGRAYVIVFIDDWCVVGLPTTRLSDTPEEGSA